MTRKEHLLLLFEEECVETAQRISKAIRFSLEEIQSGQDLTNEERIIHEFNDILAVVEVLQEEGILSPNIENRELIQRKKENIIKYTRYSEQIGTIIN